MRAYCNRGGVIDFTNGPVPDGKLLLGSHHDANKLRNLVEGIARHGYEPGVLLVPGVPEASDEDKALEAVVRFGEIVRRRLNDVRVPA